METELHKDNISSLPTKSTKSGALTAISFESALMSGSLSCILPAVSTRTTSIRELRA